MSVSAQQDHRLVGGTDLHPVLRSLMQASGVDSLHSLFATGSPDWGLLEHQAATHRMSGLLYEFLRRPGTADRVSPEVLQRLKQEVNNTAGRNLVLWQELVPVLKACATQRLRCVPLRGVAVASWLHPDPILRPMDDLDVLVPREDLPAFLRLLNALGYEQVDHRADFAEAFYYSLELVTPRGVLVEPHWTVAYPPFCRHFDMAPIWDRASQHVCLDVDAWTLDHTDLVLHLCLHLAHKRTMAPFLWWAELDHGARQAAVDWDRLGRQASDSGQGPLVADVLRTLRHICATPLPKSALDSRQGAPRSVTDRVLTDSTLIGREQFATLLSLPGFRLKARYALGLLLPSPSFMRQRYGISRPAALCLYYPIRVAHLLWEGLKGIGVLAGLSAPWRAGRST